MNEYISKEYQFDLNEFAPLFKWIYSKRKKSTQKGINLPPFSNESIQKGKNLLPLGANSSLYV